MDFFKEFYQFIIVRKKYWLLPIILVTLLLVGLIYFSSGTVVAPFVYTLF